VDFFRFLSVVFAALVRLIVELFDDGAHQCLPSATSQPAFCAEMNTAVTLVQKDRPKEAERLFDHALAQADDYIFRDTIKARAASAYLGNGSRLDDDQKWDAAIVNYTLAMKYAPGDPEPFYARGTDFERKLDMRAAVADYSQAIRRSDRNAAYYLARGGAREMSVDFPGALADYDQAVRLGPTANAYHMRGRAEFILGAYDAALNDIRQGMELSDREPSTVLWLHLVRMRMGTPDADELRRNAKDVSADWPQPALLYFLGKLSAGEMVNIGLTSNQTANAYQRCDGWFYLGEEALAHGDKAAARTLFAKTVQGCDALDFEWAMAQGELQRLPN
jgi:lipoprotein NlpI